MTAPDFLLIFYYKIDTKRLAEVLVEREYGKIPAVIVRPSIVSPAWLEPVPGV